MKVYNNFIIIILFCVYMESIYMFVHVSVGKWVEAGGKSWMFLLRHCPYYV